MLPPSRLLDAYRSAEQAAKRHPYAAIVEFGVYRGGGLAAMSYGASLTGFTCPVIGFDTFEGHTAALLPHEVDLHGNFQRPIFDQKQSKGEAWTDCDIKSVFDNYKAFMGELQHEPPP